MTVKMDVGVMVMKGYSIFAKLQDMSLTIKWCSFLPGALDVAGVSYSFTDMQSEYSTAPADWARS